MSTPADYYAQKDREAREALEKLKAARCRWCKNFLRSKCAVCDGTGLAPGVTREEYRKLEAAYEMAADTGD